MVTLSPLGGAATVLSTALSSKNLGTLKTMLRTMTGKTYLAILSHLRPLLTLLKYSTGRETAKYLLKGVFWIRISCQHVFSTVEFSPLHGQEDRHVDGAGEHDVMQAVESVAVEVNVVGKRA